MVPWTQGPRFGCGAMRDPRPPVGHFPSDTRGPPGAVIRRSKIANSLGGRPNVYSGSNKCPRIGHVEGREVRYFRFVARHYLRVVRFLPLRGAGAILRLSVL